MDLGMIGLGRMGANLVRRLLRDGHRAVVYDVHLLQVLALLAMEPSVSEDALLGSDWHWITK
jgi:6-phosphogluconate dehydrogenase